MPPMKWFSHRRSVVGMTLLAFMFALAHPLLVQARQAWDPLLDVTVCRVVVSDQNGSATANSSQTPTDTQPASLTAGHCAWCLTSVAVPPVAPILVNGLTLDPIPALSPPASIMVLRVHAALQPLNPRAPPRG